MRKHEINKILLEKFTLDQLHEFCKQYKREMDPINYRDRVVMGESDKSLIKKRFITYMAGFFDQSEIKEFAREKKIDLN